jgi:hypothetical protein
MAPSQAQPAHGEFCFIFIFISWGSELYFWCVCPSVRLSICDIYINLLYLHSTLTKVYQV